MSALNYSTSTCSYYYCYYYYFWQHEHAQKTGYGIQWPHTKVKTVHKPKQNSWQCFFCPSPFNSDYSDHCVTVSGVSVMLFSVCLLVLIVTMDLLSWWCCCLLYTHWTSLVSPIVLTDSSIVHHNITHHEFLIRFTRTWQMCQKWKMSSVAVSTLP